MSKLSRGLESLNRTDEQRQHEFHQLLDIIGGYSTEPISPWERQRLEEWSDLWPFTPTEKQCTILREIKDKILES